MDSPRDDYLDVLLLCAAPLDIRPALNLAVEVAHFEAEVLRSTIPIRLRRVFPPTREQLERELSPAVLRRRSPKVFHFLGHGEEDGLWFETEDGMGERVSAARLRRLFENTPIRLALLNACWSATSRVKSLCRHLVDDAGLAAAIGHGKPVADTSAITFARRFYAEITRGQPVDRACFAGVNAVAEADAAGAAEIELTGDGRLRLDEGLAPGERPGRVEDGMPTRGYLPDPGFFCGRAEEFRQVARSLADPSIRGFGLWGIGGIGKTALATEAARRNAWRFREGGVVFVDAREVTPPTTADLLRRALARLDPAAQGNDPVFELVTRLKSSPGLLVLDNLETLPEDQYDTLARFVRQVPANGSHVLLTARAPIPAVEDLPDVPTHLFTTGLHDVDGTHYAHRLAETKGITLLRDDPPRIEAGEVRGLCARVSRRVSGHPRMIEVAVGVARRRRAALDKALDGLAGELEAKLTEMMGTGLALVGDEGRRLLAYLPLFPAGNLMPEALRAACARAEPPDEAEDDEEAETDDDMLAWVEEGLRQLERGGFLDRDQKQDIFTFHATLQDHAGRIVVLRPERSSAGFFGLLFFYAGYLRDNKGNYAAISRCLENALNAMETAWSARRDPGPLDAILASMVDALGYLFELRGLWQLGDRWNERAITLRRESEAARDDAALSHELYRRAGLLRSHGQYEEARRLYRESLQFNESIGNLCGQAASLHQLAIIESAQSDPAEARRLWERSIALKDRIGDVDGRASTLGMLAQLEAMEGNLEKALGMARESVRLLEGIGSAKAATVRAILANLEARAAGGSAEVPPFLAELQTLLERGKAAGPEEGLAAADAALDVARRDGAPARENVALLARVVVCWQARDVAGCDEALRQAEEALGRVGAEERAVLVELVEQLQAQTAKDTPPGPQDSDHLYAEAMAKAEAGAMAGALGLFEASLAASRQEGDSHSVAINLLMIGQSLLALGRIDEARDRLREGLEQASDLGDEALLKALREAVAVAAALAKGTPADAPARGPDEGPERPDDVAE